MLIGHPSTVKLATIGSLTVFWVTFLDDDELVVLDDDDDVVLVNFVLFFITASLMTVTAELLELLLRFLGTVIKFFLEFLSKKKKFKIIF